MGQKAAEIRASLKHPVIDGDGHWMEPIPIFLEYLDEALPHYSQLGNLPPRS